ncbi:disabled homolog 1-like isoform X2 [Mya arenaria]|uniref:disabled homolog 1-like isoform X2 n=1 Tax=Mya arenaria TaxID=6604 RepID=UPI0022E7BED4|nr:disabled homolog 1-like isoform X2 [Mya arenaria]
MSSTENTTTAESTDTNTNKTEEENKQDSQNNNQTKPIKKVKSKKDLKNDPSRFDPPGVNFNAKLIGVDEVESARGDKMCQESIYRLKVAVKQSGQHKQKIIINVSVDGIRIIDLRTQSVNFTHPVHRISFISRDITDNRAFGYVYGAGEGKHKFFAIKTDKAAEALVLTLRDLFQVVYELKKQEVEDAKNKIDEPEKAGEAKEGESEEPVYSEIEVKEKKQEKEKETCIVKEVPNKKTENEQTNEVPPNNQPVVTEAPDLLNLENEMEAMEKRIEQIDTMEELFKELEAPPPANSSNPSSSISTSFSSDLAGLSTTAPLSTFSVGGAPFGAPFGGNQQFGPNPFPGAGQPFGAPGMQGGQHFGVQPPVSQAFGQPAGGFGANFPPTSIGGFGAAPNPFGAPPSVPPRAVGGFPGQPGFPGTPFPGAQQKPGFPSSPQPQINAQPPPASDPFGNDPFDISSGFDDNVLMPARKEEPSNEQPTSKGGKDAFGDLLSLEPKGNPNLKGKDMFTALSTPEKKSLNQIKGKSPSPKPPSSPKASDENDSFSSNHAASPEDPFSTSMPFGTSDPFANDPFASSTPALPSNPPNAQVNDAVINDTRIAQINNDPYNIPLPQMPPPPLPQDVASHINMHTKTTSVEGPPPPPRPNIPPPSTDPPSLPPIPPRPKSGASDSSRSSTASLNSIHDTGHQQTPSLPPRPRVGNFSVTVPSPRADNSSVTVPGLRTDNFNGTVPSQGADKSSALFSSPMLDNSSATVPSKKGANPCVTVPRPRPRASLSKLSTDLTNVNSKDNVIKNDNVISGGDSLKTKVLNNGRISMSNNDQQFTNTSHTSAKTERLNSTESQHSSISDSPKVSTQRSSSVIADPFVSEDPFGHHDPFTQTDPFANDPFAGDPFSDIGDSTSSKTDDPFTTAVASPRKSDNSDPFSVFDNKILNDSFKFDRSSSKKGKSKVSG